MDGNLHYHRSSGSLDNRLSRRLEGGHGDTDREVQAACFGPNGDAEAARFGRPALTPITPILITPITRSIDLIVRTQRQQKDRLSPLMLRVFEYDA